MENILAYIDPDKCLRRIENIAYAAFFEISFLIKNRVVWQKLLVIYRFYLFVMNHCSRIVYFTAFSANKTNNCYNVYCIFFKFIQVNDIFVNKRLLEKKIFRGIAGNGKLRKYYYICIIFFCFFDMRSNDIIVSFEISDSWINLCQI